MKSPFFIIAALFLAFYMLVSHFSSDSFSSEPVILKHSQTPDIIMLGTQSCRYCSIARAFFDTHKLPYVEKDIEHSDKDMQMFYMLGGRGTPLLIVNGRIIHGWDEAAVRDSL